METLQSRFMRLDKLVRKIHSDKLPFIGSVNVGNVSQEYYRWLAGELRS